MYKLSTALLCVFMVACGYKGPLYLPKQNPAPTKNTQESAITPKSMMSESTPSSHNSHSESNNLQTAIESTPAN